MPSTIDPALTPLVSAPLDGLDFAYDLGDYGSPLISTGVGVTPLVVQGFAGQTADLVRIETSALANLVSVGPTGVIKFGADMDTNLYRSAANVLKTDDHLIVDGGADIVGVAGVNDFALEVVQPSSGYPALRVGNDNSTGIDATLRIQALWGWWLQFGGQGMKLWSTSSGDAAQVPLTIRGAPSQTGNHQEWQNDAGAVLMRVKGSYLGLSQDTGGGIHIGEVLVYDTNGVQNIWTPYNSSKNALTARGKAGQTADLQQWQDSGENVLAAIGKDGKLLFGASGAQDTNLYRSAANTLKTDDSFFMSSTGATEAAPRTFGFSDIGSGTAARLQFGDGNNALQNGFGTNQQLYSFHSLELRGNRRIGGGAGPAFVVGGATQPGTSIINDRDQIALAVKGFSTLTADLTQWQTSAGVILTSIDAAGKLVFGPSGAQDIAVYRSSAENLAIKAYGGSGATRVVIDSAATAALVLKGSVKQHSFFSEATTGDFGMYNETNGNYIARWTSAGATAMDFTIGDSYKLKWSDANLYRSAASVLKTDHSLTVASSLRSNYGLYINARNDASNDAKAWAFFSSTDGHFAFWQETVGAEVFELNTTIADTETAMLVRRNVAGAYSLQRVTQGAADSGGAGFRVLRIPN